MSCRNRGPYLNLDFLEDGCALRRVASDVVQSLLALRHTLSLSRIM
jgi:hypothetical protein